MKVNLWFARDKNNEIVSIIDKSVNSKDTYTCPICSSKVIPKAIDSKKITPHFAHMDVTKCNSESMIHFWMKHKFIERGDTFKIKTNEEIEFTCKDLDVEVTFQLESGTYRPDLVIYTECGQEIIFEMANSNKKKVQDYIDRWIELDRIVVEVDIKSLQNENNVKVLNALYYKGRCFNFNKRDGGYYNTIGKLKEEMKSSGEYDIELVKKLDWFWNEIVKYETGIDIDFNEMVALIEHLNSRQLLIVTDALKNRKSYKVLEEFYRRKDKIMRLKVENKNKIFLDKYFNKSKINDYLRSNAREYTMKGSYMVGSNVFISFELSNNNIITVKVKTNKNIDSNIEYIISQLPNRIAYQEIKNNIKEAISELNKNSGNIRYYVEYSRVGFELFGMKSCNIKKNIYECHEFVSYDSVYKEKHKYMNKEEIKNRLKKG